MKPAPADHAARARRCGDRGWRAGRRADCAVGPVRRPQCWWSEARPRRRTCTTRACGAVACQPRAAGRVGMWPDSLPATPIDTVHISQQATPAAPCSTGVTRACHTWAAPWPAPTLCQCPGCLAGSGSQRGLRCPCRRCGLPAATPRSASASLARSSSHRPAGRLADGGSLVSAGHPLSRARLPAVRGAGTPASRTAASRGVGALPMARWQLLVGDDLMAVDAVACRSRPPIELDDEAFVAEFAELPRPPGTVDRLRTASGRAAQAPNGQPHCRPAGPAGNAAQTMYPIAAQG